MREPPSSAGYWPLALIGALVAVVSELAYRFGESTWLGADLARGAAPSEHLEFVARNIAIGLIVTGLALRYFYVTYQWRENVELQARAREP